jgi:hypothetical protein
MFFYAEEEEMRGQDKGRKEMQELCIRQVKVLCPAQEMISLNKYTQWVINDIRFFSPPEYFLQK